MWRYIAAALLVVVGLLLSTPAVVQADSSAEVVVTAVGYIVGVPGPLTLTYINDSEIGLSWTKGEGAKNTLIMRCFGRYPEDREDGVQVYYGEGTSTSDWYSVALSLPAYYRAWSQKADGAWEEIGTTGEGSFMSQSFLFIGLLALGFGLFVAAFRWKDMLLSYAAALTWLAIGFWWILGDITNFGIGESWVQILMFIPFILAFTVLLRLMNTEITEEAKGGKSWKSWGQPPKEKKVPRRETYRETLRGRIRK